MVDGIESALRDLISKVEASQSTIDNLEGQVRDLKLKIESKEIAYKKCVSDSERAMRHTIKLQEELERYFLLCLQQSEIIESAEELQRRSTNIIYSSIPDLEVRSLD